ncbi:MAG: ribulose-phosphate 3-epimerase [Butyrivibrio sp.]|nr:ribulose-phosphate 3-epimerase [Butyrivibrio sp.]
MKNILCPSILSADFSKLGEQIKTVDDAGAEYLHIDVMDGSFVPSISFGMPVIKSIRGITDMVFDLHLMILDPIRYIKEFAEIGADIITFHIEATNDPDAVIDEIHKYGKKASISLKPGTDVEVLRPYLDKLDMILLMAVEPGFGGQKFIPATLDRIKAVRQMLNEKNLDTDIEIDGGVYANNVQMVLDAGANVIVSGSGIYKGDPVENVKAFQKILQQ